MAGAVGQSLPHDSLRGHVTGRSVFLADVPPVQGELTVDAACSPVAHGAITGIDLGDARRVPGIVGLYTAADVPRTNYFGPIVGDDRLLAEGDVLYQGEPVVLIAGETPEAVREARKRIRFEISPLTPITTIDAAIAAGSFLGPQREVRRGDAEGALRDAGNVLQGRMEIGGQEHLYLESQGAIAYPGEDGQLVIHASTQNTTEIQDVVAEVLGLGQHQVVCVCKRMGGAFGGKETQAALPALMAALVAHKTGRAARCLYGKADDMRRTGKRHPYRAEYEVGFTGEGVISALKAAFYSDGGATTDLSPGIMDRTLFHVDNAYFLPHVALTGRICRTHLPSNTAFRGFGGPQGVAVVENIMEEIAQTLGLDAFEVRRRNCYGAGARSVTPYGQTVPDEGALPALFQRLAGTAEYLSRRESVAAFNARSRTHVRGLSMTLVKFGISFTSTFLNQANALVNVYKDGTVQVSTGGAEMGQGLNTKIKQLVADELGVLPDGVRVMPVSTEKNNNTPPTAASAGTDLNGSAAVLAAAAIRRRLARFAADLLAQENGLPVQDPAAQIAFAEGCVYDRRAPERQIPFGELAHRAHRERIDLGERSFYKTPGLGKDRPFFYYTLGGALAEVCIDRLTGEMAVERVDILMDIGRSINPAIDRGQLLGGFVQGMGWVTTEKLKYGEDGTLLSWPVSGYKIPSVLDLPPVFNVAFVEGAENPENVASSKAVGEPPLLLAISVWTAAKNALSFVCDGVPRLNLPATGEEILLCLHRQGRKTGGGDA